MDSKQQDGADVGAVTEETAAGTLQPEVPEERRRAGGGPSPLGDYSADSRMLLVSAWRA